MTILELPGRLEYLSEELRDIFHRIYSFQQSEGHLKVPEPMKEWVIKQFGGVEEIERQRLLKIENKVINHGVIFNEIRSSRPQVKIPEFDIESLLVEAMDGPFAKPFEMTPEDVFGRIESEYCITASNVAKFDAWHGLLIFKQATPFLWSKEEVADYIDVANQWFRKVHESDTNANYPFFLWNSLWRAGSSIVHGHAQMTVSSSPYTQIELWRKNSLQYQTEAGSNYFDDLFTLHKALELAWEDDHVRIILPIAPKKEREVMLLGNAFDKELASALYHILSAYRDGLHIYSFNLAIYLQPFQDGKDWGHMPVVVRLIDRGSLSTRNSELGAIELFAQEVIEHDPYRTYEALQEALGN